ncbi:hypothetical protein Tsubulata_000922 [Turnera subulata]|uniref:SP-RING-type domain-containing protein n=1 Tax=Turnera subulata TaxID=218843 RepID=A0A9Q0JHX3_9ROSI|nr:hypothetical protein Tsubulata_000922 [Turnera subulata]
MAPPSTSSRGGTAGRMRTATSVLTADNQSLLAEIRRAFIVMKGIAVDLEKENESAMVKSLENTVVELLENFQDFTHQTAAIESVGQRYQQPTTPQESSDFKKLLETEFGQLKAAPSSDAQKQQLLSQFREAIWNVHHSGMPPPGEEQEDVVMTSTQSTVLNITCPITLKPLTELSEPVRW